MNGKIIIISLKSYTELKNYSLVSSFVLNAFILERVTKLLYRNEVKQKNVGWYVAITALKDRSIISDNDHTLLHWIREKRNDISHAEGDIEFTTSEQNEYVKVKACHQFLFYFIDRYFVQNLFDPKLLNQ